MKQHAVPAEPDDWGAFPGGELEGRRPRALCRACREKLKAGFGASPRPAGRRTICFACYRAELERDRALHAAGTFYTGSDTRFQAQLPLEPVNQPRLESLKSERAASRARQSEGVGRFVDKRGAAQIEARHALQRIAAGLNARVQTAAASAHTDRDLRAGDRVWASAVHAAELQLPDAWLPFVVSR